jgi:hypothetical protein
MNFNISHLKILNFSHYLLSSLIIPFYLKLRVKKLNAIENMISFNQLCVKHFSDKFVLNDK